MSLKAYALTVFLVMFRFGDTVMVFKEIDGMLINNGCQDCEALKKGKELRTAPLKDEWLLGGTNPFAARCKHLMGGTVLIGVDKSENESAFCRFEDGSFLR